MDRPGGCAVDRVSGHRRVPADTNHHFLQFCNNRIVWQSSETVLFWTFCCICKLRTPGHGWGASTQCWCCDSAVSYLRFRIFQAIITERYFWSLFYLCGQGMSWRSSLCFCQPKRRCHVDKQEKKWPKTCFQQGTVIERRGKRWICVPQLVAGKLLTEEFSFLPTFRPGAYPLEF